jgi:hypothetical protein
MTGTHLFDCGVCHCRVVSGLAELAAPAITDPSLPRHWELVNPTYGNKHLVLLTKAKHADELAEVAKHWQQTRGQGIIVSVHRIQNPALHHRFEGMRKNTPGLAEQVAYHGTRTNAPALIYDSPTGFDMSRGMSAPGSVTVRQCTRTISKESATKEVGWCMDRAFMLSADTVHSLRARVVAICILRIMHPTAAPVSFIRSVPTPAVPRGFIHLEWANDQS